MAYTVFYRKYRPSSFDQVFGQSAITITLLQALKTGNVSHAYLLCGPRGTGKTTLARLIAKGVNCLNLQATGEPCNQCSNCEDIKNNSFPDIIEIDAASNRSIDDVRELKDKVSFMPLQGKKKVYIIDEVHMLTKEAFNALLKTLEEPPAHVHFILATTERHKVPPTIISRTQSFLLKPLSEPKVLELLKGVVTSEGIAADEDALTMIALASEGGARDALTLLEQCVIDKAITATTVTSQLGFVSSAVLEKFFHLWQSGDNAEKMIYLETLYNDGIIVDQFVKQAIYFARKLLHHSVRTGAKDRDWLFRCIEQLIQCERQLHYTPIAILALELAYLGLVPTDQTPTAAPPSPPQPIVAPKPLVSTPPAVPAPTTSPIAQAVESSHSPLADSIQQPTNTSPSLVEKWQRTVKQIQHASTKMALKNSDIVQENDRLIVYVNSQFEMTKVQTNQALQSIRDAVGNEFGSVLDVEFRVKHDLPQAQAMVTKVQAIFGTSTSAA